MSKQKRGWGQVLLHEWDDGASRFIDHWSNPISLYIFYILTFVLRIRSNSFFGPIHGLIQVAHSWLFPNNKVNLNQRFANVHTYSIPAQKESWYYSLAINSFPFLFLAKSPLHHSMEVNILFTPNVNGTEIEYKFCWWKNVWWQDTPTNCSLRISSLDKEQMRVISFFDALAWINYLPYKVYFAHILKHQIYAIAHKWSPGQCWVPLQ